MRIYPWTGLQLDVTILKDRPRDAIKGGTFLRCTVGRMQHPAIIFIVVTAKQTRRFLGIPIRRKRKYAIPVWVD